MTPDEHRDLYYFSEIVFARNNNQPQLMDKVKRLIRLFFRKHFCPLHFYSVEVL